MKSGHVLSVHKSKDDFVLGGAHLKNRNKDRTYDPQSYITNKRSTRLIQNADHL